MSQEPYITYLLTYFCNFQKRNTRDRSFPVAASCAWNSPPAAVRDTPSLLCFRRRLKTSLFQSTFNCQLSALYFHSVSATDYVKCPCNNFIEHHFSQYFVNNDNNNRARVVPICFPPQPQAALWWADPVMTRPPLSRSYVACSDETAGRRTRQSTPTCQVFHYQGWPHLNKQNLRPFWFLVNSDLRLIVRNLTKFMLMQTYTHFMKFTSVIWAVHKICVHCFRLDLVFSQASLDHRPTLISISAVLTQKLTLWNHR